MEALLIGFGVLILSGLGYFSLKKPTKKRKVPRGLWVTVLLVCIVPITFLVLHWIGIDPLSSLSGEQRKTLDYGAKYVTGFGAVLVGIGGIFQYYGLKQQQPEEVASFPFGSWGAGLVAVGGVVVAVGAAMTIYGVQPEQVSTCFFNCQESP